MQKKFLLNFFLGTLGSTFLVGCFLFTKPPLDPRIAARLKGRGGPLDNPTAGVAVRSAGTPQFIPTIETPAPVSYGAEVTWEVPDETADAYILYYGSAPDSLRTQVKVTPAQLATFRDLSGKMRYRHVLKPVEIGQPMYVAIAAEKGGVVSERSEVQEVSVQQSVPVQNPLVTDPAAALPIAPTPIVAPALPTVAPIPQPSFGE